MRLMKMYIPKLQNVKWSSTMQVSQRSDKPFTDAESYADVNEF